MTALYGLEKAENQVKEFMLKEFGVEVETSSKYGHQYCVEVSAGSNKGIGCRIDVISADELDVLRIYAPNRETCPYLCCQQPSQIVEKQKYGTLYRCRNRHEWFAFDEKNPI